MLEVPKRLRKLSKTLHKGREVFKMLQSNKSIEAKESFLRSHDLNKEDLASEGKRIIDSASEGAIELFKHIVQSDPEFSEGWKQVSDYEFGPYKLELPHKRNKEESRDESKVYGSSPDSRILIRNGNVADPIISLSTNPAEAGEVYVPGGKGIKRFGSFEEFIDSDTFKDSNWRLRGARVGWRLKIGYMDPLTHEVVSFEEFKKKGYFHSSSSGSTLVEAEGRPGFYHDVWRSKALCAEYKLDWKDYLISTEEALLRGYDIGFGPKKKSWEEENA